MISMVQTLVGVTQGADLFDTAPYREPYRLLPMIPLILLATCALISGFITIAFKAHKAEADLAYRLTPTPEIHAAYIKADVQHRAALAAWVFSSFLTDLIMTTTSVVFLLRSRTGLSMHDGVFKTIWGIMWASAAPPFVSMLVIVICGYMVQPKLPKISSMSAGVTAKLFNLSLMINVVGQGYIHRQFQEAKFSQPSASLPRGGMSSQLSAPRFAHRTTSSSTSFDHELDITRGSKTQSTSFSVPNSHGAPDYIKSDASITGHGQNDPEANYTHNVRLGV
ncbi:hypothetical protein CTheo_7103 [Ceratobasidium theobromae]|uniref:Transmembrane protein n=1 Tax=Ceratobasidium theobromae TaxID=1582974 RepID=A0A5N5QCW8_9AGAM|nr:hypothetical protein CTheo_7103 [Ceratobasidium theobromae]